MGSLVLTRLVTYPIKSARGVELTESRVGERGLDLDRRFMVVDEGGNLATARRHPRLLTMAVALEPGGLAVTAPGRPGLRVPLEPAGPERPVRVWNDWTLGLEVGPEATGWFSDLLGAPFSLVFMPERAERRMLARFGPARISYVDGNPLHLVSESSLADLEGRVGAPLEVERFRPNLVVRGAPAYDEDGWARLRLGGLELMVYEPCARCAMVNLDPLTGVAGAEPLRTLARSRRSGKTVPFGQNLLAPAPGRLRVGDGGEVVARLPGALARTTPGGEGRVGAL